MNSVKFRISAALAALMLVMALPVIGGNKLIMLDKQSGSLTEKCDYALEKARSMGLSDYWITYGFKKMLNRHSHLSSCHNSSSRTFSSILTGKDDERSKIDSNITLRDYTIRIKNDRDDDDGVKTLRNVIVLMKVSRDGSINKVMYGTEESSFCMDDQPVVWLGIIDSRESIGFLKAQYKSSDNVKLKKGIMGAIANHDLKKEILPFLKDKYENDTDKEIRESAVFWLGIQDDPGTIEYLEGIAYSDESQEIRKEAVFAIYLGKCDESINSLVKLARSKGEKEVRKTAIFWLGQKAEKKSLDLLGDIVENEENVKLAKEAVFAISQHESSNSLTKLFEIAKTHKSKEVRKSAIFWLSQMDDERVVDFLEEIVDAR